MESLLEIRFPARVNRIKLIRGSVRMAARMCGFADPISQDIVLAVDEACQNVIVHAYRGKGDGEIILSLFRREGGLLVHLRDFADPIDATLVRPRDLSDVKPGKLGSHFMKTIMDTVKFHAPPEGGNLLEMFKRRI